MSIFNSPEKRLEICDRLTEMILAMEDDRFITAEEGKILAHALAHSLDIVFALTSLLRQPEEEEPQIPRKPQLTPKNLL